MNRYKILILIISMSINQIIIGQENFENPINTAIDTIPFELTSHNNLSIKAILNEVDTVNLMFHTAANGITLIKEVTENLTKIKWTEEDKVKSWGGESESRYSENNLLQISKFKWDSISIWENENSGPTTDGKFGPNLFKDKVIEIDFDKSVLIIQEQLPTKIREHEKLQLIYENGFMFIEGTSRVGGENYPNRFLIHSGYGGTILYDDKFVEETKIGDQIEITEEQELKDSYGNILKTKKGNLPRFTIGSEEFKDIPVGFFEGSIGRQKMSVIGGNLLKRFNLIIDSSRENIYIKQNQLKDLPYKDV